jgi:hypothetical protein
MFLPHQYMASSRSFETCEKQNRLKNTYAQLINNPRAITTVSGTIIVKEKSWTTLCGVGDLDARSRVVFV